MNKRLIYLDNSATTFPKPEIVYKEMDRVNREMAVNAGRGSYSLAKKASEMIVDVKKKILELFNAPERAEVILTPSITIALNQILQGITVPSGSNIYVSPYEHNAVARTVNLIAKRCNVNIIEIPIDASSLEIDMKRLESIFALHKPYVVCCSHISNVTGYILPVEEIFNLSKKYNAINVLDTAQSAGLININLCKLNADFVAFAGHKTLYGPFGIGGFVDISKIKLNEVIVGGTGSDFFKARNMNVAFELRGLEDQPSFDQVGKIISKAVGMYQNELFDELYVCYNHHVNSLSSEVRVEQMLPIADLDPNESEGHVLTKFELEPDRDTILDQLLPQYAESLIYGAIVDAKTAEHAAGMTAMQTATDNAKNVINDLTIQYNRARQAAITQEITEIVGGASALE